MRDFSNEFRSYLSCVKRSSKNTIESYMRDLERYCAFLQKSLVEDTTTVSSALLQQYIDSLYQEGKSEATVTRIVSTLKGYYRFLQSIEVCSQPPTENLHRQHKAEKKLPEILDYKEVQKLLEQPDTGDLKGIRDKAMLELLYATGIRVSELITLNVDDINLPVGIVHLKSAKSERIVPLYKEAVKTLSLYLTQVRHIIIADSKVERLFTNMNGAELTRQGFWKIIKGYAAAAGIKKDITPHTIRHSFAAHLLENGAELTDIKELLGHTDISSTQVYSKIIKQKYASAYTRFHPMARKN